MRWFVLLFLIVLQTAWTLPLWADDWGGESEMEKRLLNPDRSKRALYEGKMFETGSGFSSKSFTTGEYAGIKDFESKSFATKTFEGSKKGWLSKMFPEKKLPEKLQGANRDATKQFASKNLSLKSYAGLEKKSNYSDQDAYATREFAQKIPEIDNSPALQQELRSKVKTGLSEEDVRKLLNKPL